MEKIDGIKCDYCAFVAYNKEALLLHQMHKCLGIRRKMVEEAIEKKGEIFPVGSKPETPPITLLTMDLLKFTVENVGKIFLQVWFDFGSPHPTLKGRSTTVITKQIG